ncbi:methyltransferase domain-containing protein [Leisingera sp. S132]|uniref:methyltransferase domain-containing protein n=1 Tax=Leisingera sp. S132 TaxID=2867016 RepID=UPI0021A44086|nr:methyltransferase domain-containing protein [Leisingera sp. S132]UWQ80390.1 methyltransferase domain-containing protein [Leisingera sp. S132]
MKDMQPPHLEQSRVQKSFRRGLESYHGAASVQAETAAHLARMLQDQGAPRHFGRVLEFGCGTGHFTRQLLQRFSAGSLVLNDLVPEAAQVMQALEGDTQAKTRFKGGPIESLPLPQDLDLIASASTVQWIPDLPALMARLAAHLTPGGWLALSGFGRGQFRELAAMGSAAAAPSYLDADEWPSVLPEGLEIRQIAQRPAVLEFASALHLLRHLRQTGVNGNARQGWSRRQLRSFEDAYRERFGQGGKLPLTYDPVLLVARRTG